MRFEWKVMIMGLCFSFICMLSFTYVSSLSQKTIYAYQVGIYKEKENMQKKVNELQEQGYNPQSYIKDNQYYVLSMLSQNEKEILNHSKKVKGIIKKYVVSYDMSYEQLLTNLSSDKINE